MGSPPTRLQQKLRWYFLSSVPTILLYSKAQLAKGMWGAMCCCCCSWCILVVEMMAVTHEMAGLMELKFLGAFVAFQNKKQK